MANPLTKDNIFMFISIRFFNFLFKHIHTVCSIIYHNDYLCSHVC